MPVMRSAWVHNKDGVTLQELYEFVDNCRERGINGLSTLTGKVTIRHARLTELRVEGAEVIEDETSTHSA